jgi:hypothetical protein
MEQKRSEENANVVRLSRNAHVLHPVSMSGNRTAIAQQQLQLMSDTAGFDVVCLSVGWCHTRQI